jgi:hypothetical protein
VHDAEEGATSPNLELGAAEQVDSVAAKLNSTTEELKSAAEQLQSIVV